MGDDPTQTELIGKLDRSDTALFVPDAGSRALIVVFGSNFTALSRRPVYDLSFQTASWPADRLYLRDPRAMWFLAGLEGLTDSVRGTRDLIAALIGRGRYDRIIFIGISSGTLAAAGLGIDLDVDEIVALAPITTIDPQERRADSFSSAVRARLEAVLRIPDLERRYVDLRPLLPEKNERTTFTLVYDPLLAKDARHATRLGDWPGLVRVPVPGVGHRPADMLQAVGAEEMLKPQ